MEEIETYYKKAVELMELLLKRDDFKAWLNEAEDIPDNMISDMEKLYALDSGLAMKDDFQQALESHANKLIGYIQAVAKNQRLMKLCNDNFWGALEGYVKDEHQIKHPGMLKLIAGYKKYKEENK